MNDASKDWREEERKQERERWAELARAPLGELIGVVRPRGIGGVGSRVSDEPFRWMLQIDLMAWRFDGGPVWERPLCCVQLVGGRKLESMMKEVRESEVVRMRARVPERELGGDGLIGRMQAEMVKFLGAAEDNEMGRVAARLRKPVRIKDPKLGTLTLDRAFDRWEGRAAWDGRRVRLNLGQDGGTLEDSMRHAKVLFSAAGRRRWNSLVRRVMLKDLYRIYSEGWREDGERELSRTQFLAKFKLTSVEVEPEGSVSLLFSDGDLFGGHDVVLRGSVEGEVRDWDLVG